jgi:hypothetical protein
VRHAGRSGPPGCTGGGGTVRARAGPRRRTGPHSTPWTRTLRQRGTEPSGSELRAVYGQCLDGLPADQADHPLDADIAAAEGLLAAWA